MLTDKRALPAACLTLVLLAVAQLASAACTGRPNIILFIMDDVGWSDFPFFSRPLDFDALPGGVTTKEYAVMTPTRNRLDARLFATQGFHDIGSFGNPPFDQMFGSSFPVYPVDAPTTTLPSAFYRAPGGPCDTNHPCDCLPPAANCTAAERTRDILDGFGGLKRLADSGVVFSRFYAAGAVCLPTRSSMMMGRHGEQMNQYIWGNEGKARVPASEVTIAEYLTANLTANCASPPCYRTGLVGKWHVSEDPPRLEGFDDVYGYDKAFRSYFAGKPLDCAGSDIAGCDSATHKSAEVPGVKDNCWEDRWPASSSNSSEPDPAKRGCPFSVRVFADKAVEFIQAAQTANTPFFLVVAFTSVHKGTRAPARTIQHYTTNPKGTPKKGSYWALIEETDAAIGHILDALGSDLGNTVVFFTSDQGPEHRTFTYGDPMLRGGKFTVFDGGIRIPFIAKPCGDAQNVPRIVDDLGSQVDLFRTIAEAAGAPAPSKFCHATAKACSTSADCSGNPCEPRYVEGRSLYDLINNPTNPGSGYAERDFVYARHSFDVAVVSRAGYFTEAAHPALSGGNGPLGRTCSYYAEVSDDFGVTRNVRGASCVPCNVPGDCTGANVQCRVLGMRCVPSAAEGQCVNWNGQAEGPPTCQGDTDCGIDASGFPRFCSYIAPGSYPRCVRQSDCTGSVCRPISLPCGRCEPAAWKLKTAKDAIPGVIPSDGGLFDVASNPEEDFHVYQDCRFDATNQGQALTNVKVTLGQAEQTWKLCTDEEPETEHCDR